MDTILVEVYLPAAGKSFELRLPRALNSQIADQLAAEAVSSLSDGTYLPSHASMFAMRDTGVLLDMKRSLEQNNLHNGSRILLL